MLRLVITLVSLLFVTHAYAWTHGSSANSGWQVLKVGSGGALFKLDLVQSDNTMTVSNDQYGCYLWSGSAWQQLVTSSRMPANSFPDSAGDPNAVFGCDELRIDPGNTSNLWMSINGNLYLSTNKGVSFSTTGYPTQPNSFLPAQTQNNKGIQPLIAVDPNNSSVVYASTTDQGLEFSNNQGATFSVVSAVAGGLPLSSNGSLQQNATDATSLTIGTGAKTFSTSTPSSLGYSAGQYVHIWETSNPANQMFGSVTSDVGTSLVMNILTAFGSGTHTDWSISFQLNSNNGFTGGGNTIAFDTSGGTTTVGGQTRTASVYVCTYGVGVFHSLDGGQTWALTSSGPTTCEDMKVDPNGTLWFLAYSNSSAQLLWTYNGTTWTQHTLTNTAVALDVDNDNCSTEATCHVAIVGEFELRYSQNAGAGSPTWNSVTGSSQFSFTATDVGWLQPLETNFGFFGTGGVKFNGSGVLYNAAEGAWFTTPTTGAVSYTWTSQTAGIEEWDMNTVISSSGGAVLMAGWDIGCIYSNTPSAYPSALTCPTPYPTTLRHGYDADYAAGSPTTMVALVDSQGGYGGGGSYVNYSGTSTNGGTTWSALTAPTGVSTGCGAACKGGNICMSSASDILWMPSDGSGGSVAPFFTTNGGTTWAQISVTGVTGGWPFQYYNTVKSCAADRTTTGKYYLYNFNTGSGGDALITCTSGGASCSITSRPGFPASTQFNGHLKTPPASTDLWFTSGWQGNGTTHPVNNGFYFSTNGGVTFTAVTGFKEVTAFGFGATFIGQTYASIVAVGWFNNVYGIWMCKNWNGSSGTWTQIGSSYPNGWTTPVLDITGDPSTPGVFYGSTGSGAFYNKVPFSFLLNRDLDPANDNSPAFLNKVG